MHPWSSSFSMSALQLTLSPLSYGEDGCETRVTHPANLPCHSSVFTCSLVSRHRCQSSARLESNQGRGPISCRCRNHPHVPVAKTYRPALGLPTKCSTRSHAEPHVCPGGHQPVKRT